MGRHAGWIALFSAISSAAHLVFIPEIPISVDKMCNVLKNREKRGKKYNIIVAAEGATLEEGWVIKKEKKDEFGHVILGGIADRIEEIVKEKLGYETRTVVLGHIQRGGSPIAFDRILATRYGLKAAQMIQDGDFGMMAGLKQNEIVAVPLEEAVGKLKTVPKELYESIEVLFS